LAQKENRESRSTGWRKKATPPGGRGGTTPCGSICYEKKRRKPGIKQIATSEKKHGKTPQPVGGKKEKILGTLKKGISTFWCGGKVKRGGVGRAG